jgi:hypothetical protein
MRAQVTRVEDDDDSPDQGSMSDMVREERFELSIRRSGADSTGRCGSPSPLLPRAVGVVAVGVNIEKWSGW